MTTPARSHRAGGPGPARPAAVLACLPALLLAACGLLVSGRSTGHGPRIAVAPAAELAHAGTVSTLAFGDGGRALVAGGADRALALGDLPRQGGFVQLWDWRAGAVKTRWTYPRPVTAVSVTPDGREWAAGDAEGRMFFSADPARIPDRSPHQRRAITALACSPDGHWIAAGSLDPDYPLGLYDLASHGMIKPVLPFTPVTALAFSPDNRHLAVGFARGGLMVWNFTASPPPQQVSRRRQPGITSLAFSPDGMLLAYGTDDGRMAILLWRMNRVLVEFVSSSLVHALAFSPDGRLLAVGQESGAVRLLEPLSGETVWSGGEGSPVSSLAFSADGGTLAVAVEARIRVYRLQDEGTDADDADRPRRHDDRPAG